MNGSIPDTLLSCNNLSFSYAPGSPEILKDISIDFEKTSFTVILGPSGCGKSTLLRLLTGRYKPSAGEVKAHSTEKLKINMIFQESGLYPWMSVVDNVAFGLKLRGVGKKERRERALFELEKVGLSHVAEGYPKQLSGGMKQRANIARAIANDPDMVLMDEPFAALDVQTRAIMQEDVIRLTEKSRRTIILVTHSIDEALLLGDRIIVLGARPGRIKEDITVPFSRPRQVNDLRSDPTFAQLHAHIWSLIESEAKFSFYGEGNE